MVASGSALNLVPLLTVMIQEEPDIVTARQRARQISSELGFPTQDQVRIATAVSEIARNAYQYGGGGRVDFAFDLRSEPQRLRIRISDDGPGIDDIETILAGDYRSESGMGIGLAGTRRLMDFFEIQSPKGGGVTVVFEKFLPTVHLRLATADCRSMVARIASVRPSGAPSEMQEQNRELMQALDSLRIKEYDLNNRMVDLARLNAELEETNRGVVALYAELDEKAVALRHADELKGRFLSHVSHEFRTPLNSILGLTHLLLTRADGELTPEQEKQVGFIRRSAHDLIEMVNDLLDLAKVDAGKTEVHLLPVDVRQLLGVLRGIMRPLATNDQVVLIIDEPADGLAIVSDESKVSQILRNLVSNALKFTERGFVRVSVRLEDGGTLAFSVEDTGVGIAAGDLERIFDEFGQVANPLQRKVKGTGLGLPLSRKLAHLLGGELNVNSSPGAGSTFTLRLPATESSGNAQALPAEPASDAVLVIDDDEASRYVARRLFDGSRWRVVEAATGIEGAERARFEIPALILLDVIMPDRSGYEVLEELKSDPATARIPVVIHTSKTLGEADYERLGDRHVAVLSKGGQGARDALERIREILGDPDLFATELTGTDGK